MHPAPAPADALPERLVTFDQAAQILSVSAHTLRHTFCSWMVQAGTDLRKVSSLMRHTDIRTTMLYAHLAPKTGQETAAIDDVLRADKR